MSKKMDELTKKFQEEDSRKYYEKFASTVHLWKLDDPEWVRQRKAVWEKILEREKQDNPQLVKSHWDEFGRFFLRAKPRVSDDVIHIDQRMAFTPFSSVDEIRTLYLNEHVSLRQNLHENLLTNASRIYRAVPEEFHRVELIADALYCEEYVAKKEPMGYENKPGFVVYYPGHFVTRYVMEVRTYLKHSMHERSFSEVTVDYFLKALEYAVYDDSGEYGVAIGKRAIKFIKDICTLVEHHEPDVVDEHRGAFVEVLREQVLNHKAIQAVLSMPDKTSG